MSLEKPGSAMVLPNAMEPEFFKSDRNFSRYGFFSETLKSIPLYVSCYKTRTNKATTSVGYALESCKSQLSSAYPALDVALLVLFL